MSPHTDDLIGNSARKFYERYVAELAKGDLELSRSLPTWQELDSGQTLAWIGAYGATVETSARMGVAITSVLPDVRAVR